MSNKITNQSYFIKRLRDSGYIVNKLDLDYSLMDPRAWTVIIDPGTASVFCTLFKNANPADLKSSELNDEYFELYDGGQYLPTKLKLKTNSIEIIITYLNKHGIINKSKNYPSNKTSINSK